MRNLLLIIAAIMLFFGSSYIEELREENTTLTKQLDDVNDWDLQYLDAMDSLIYYGNKIIEGDTLGREGFVDGFRRNSELIKELCESN